MKNRKSTAHAIALMLAMAVSGHALAQTKPSFDCAKAASVAMIAEPTGASQPYLPNSLFAGRHG